MLKKLILENFMSFRDRTELSLAPLTVILGPNSSGKSAVLRALSTLCAISLDETPEHSVLSSSYRNADEWVRIGIEFESSWAEPRPGGIRDFDGWDFDEWDFDDWSPDGLDGSLEQETLSSTFKVEYSFHPSDGGFHPAGILAGDGDGEGYGASCAFDELGGWKSEQRIRFSSGPETATQLVPYLSDMDENSVLVKAPRMAESLLRGISHVRALRPLPHQIELLQSGEPSRIFGEDLDSFAVGWDDWIRVRLVNPINRWFDRLGLPYRYGADELRWVDSRSADGAIAQSVGLRHYLTDLRSDAEVWLDGVGSGLSQVIPVILACSRLPRQEPSWRKPQRLRTLMIEQPELHLHPGLQAELAELLVDTVWRWEPSEFFVNDDEIDRLMNGNQVLVETHSEHLVLRLQRMVRNGRLLPEDVALLFVWMDEGASCAKRIRLNEFGEFIDEWPRGFFDERLDEILGD